MTARQLVLPAYRGRASGNTGMVFYGRGSGGIPTRPTLDLAIAERELQIARDDLHCNAVRLIGREVDRLVQVAERALALGLEVWLSPALWGRSPDETLHYDISAAERAERLRQQHPGRLVLVLGSELTPFMQGIVPGGDFAARTREAFTRIRAGDRSANDRLNDFLGRASTAVRGVYHGPLTYASLDPCLKGSTRSVALMITRATRTTQEWRDMADQIPEDLTIWQAPDTDYRYIGIDATDLDVAGTVQRIKGTIPEIYAD